MIDISPFQVVLIAGSSGSGKSELARRLRRENPDFATLNLDLILDAFDIAKLPLRGRAHDGHHESVEVMERLGPALLQSVLASGDQTIIEGGWIEPSSWEEVCRSSSRVAAIYLGYPNISVDKLLARLGSTEHWLGRATDRDFAASQIIYSGNLQARVLGIPRAAFVDVSTRHNQDEKIARVFRCLANAAQDN